MSNSIGSKLKQEFQNIKPQISYLISLVSGKSSEQIVKNLKNASLTKQDVQSSIDTLSRLFTKLNRLPPEDVPPGLKTQVRLLTKYVNSQVSWIPGILNNANRKQREQNLKLRSIQSKMQEYNRILSQGMDRHVNVTTNNLNLNNKKNRLDMLNRLETEIDNIIAGLGPNTNVIGLDTHMQNRNRKKKYEANVESEIQSRMKTYTEVASHIDRGFACINKGDFSSAQKNMEMALNKSKFLRPLDFKFIDASKRISKDSISEMILEIEFLCDIIKSAIKNTSGNMARSIKSFLMGSIQRINPIVVDATKRSGEGPSPASIKQLDILRQHFLPIGKTMKALSTNPLMIIEQPKKAAASSSMKVRVDFPGILLIMLIIVSLKRFLASRKERK